MSKLSIRRVRYSDAPALERICLLTGDAGKSAETLFPPDAQELIALLFALPYVDSTLSNFTTGYVLVRGENDTPIGYVLSAPDSRAFEKAANERYWPQLRQRYPLPSGVDIVNREPWANDEDIWQKEGWPVNSTVWSRRVYRLIHTAEKSMAAQEAAVAFAPTHLHIDILPEAQGQGWGTRLIAKLLEDLKERGLNALWIGMDPRNEAARRFYLKIGFQPVPGANENTLGLQFEDFPATPQSRSA